jgi:hypothetical protein
MPACNAVACGQDFLLMVFASIRVIRGQRSTSKRSGKFFRFFETSAALDPYLAYEKPQHHIHNNTLGAWLPCSFPNGASGRSGSGWRLSRRQHRGRNQRTFEPHHRHVQHGGRYIFAPKPQRRELLHGCRRWNALEQHSRWKYGHWCWGALKQYHRRQQHRRRDVRSL